MAASVHAEAPSAGEVGSLGSLVDWLTRREGAALGGVLIAAAVLRAVRWQVTAVMFNDGPVFLALAQALDRGDWAAALSHPFHPLYPALIAAGLGGSRKGKVSTSPSPKATMRRMTSARFERSSSGVA